MYPGFLLAIPLLSLSTTPPWQPPFWSCQQPLEVAIDPSSRQSRPSICNTTHQLTIHLPLATDHGKKLELNTTMLTNLMVIWFDLHDAFSLQHLITCIWPHCVPGRIYKKVTWKINNPFECKIVCILTITGTTLFITPIPPDNNGEKKKDVKQSVLRLKFLNRSMMKLKKIYEAWKGAVLLTLSTTLPVKVGTWTWPPNTACEHSQFNKLLSSTIALKKYPWNCRENQKMQIMIVCYTIASFLLEWDCCIWE